MKRQLRHACADSTTWDAVFQEIDEDGSGNREGEGRLGGGGPQGEASTCSAMLLFNGCALCYRCCMVCLACGCWLAQASWTPRSSRRPLGCSRDRPPLKLRARPPPSVDDDGILAPFRRWRWRGLLPWLLLATHKLNQRMLGRRREELQALFERVDIDGGGTISADELQAFIAVQRSTVMTAEGGGIALQLLAIRFAGRVT